MRPRPNATVPAIAPTSKRGSTETSTGSRHNPRLAPQSNSARAPFVEGSLRSAPVLVAKSRRAFAGVGPHEAIIGGFPGHEAARRAFRAVALEVDDLLAFLVRDLEVQRSVRAKLVMKPLPVVE